MLVPQGSSLNETELTQDKKLWRVTAMTKLFTESGLATGWSQLTRTQLDYCVKNGHPSEQKS